METNVVQYVKRQASTALTGWRINPAFKLQYIPALNGLRHQACPLDHVPLLAVTCTSHNSQRQ